LVPREQTPPMTDSDTDIATSAINRLGLDLLISAAKADQNILLSPYSIQCALAMAFAGADGETREEMASILRFPADDVTLQLSLSTPPLPALPQWPASLPG